MEDKKIGNHRSSAEPRPTLADVDRLLEDARQGTSLQGGTLIGALLIAKEALEKGA